MITLRKFRIVVMLFFLQYLSALSQVNTEALRKDFKNDTLINAVNASYQIAKGNTEYIGIGAGYRIDAFWGDYYSFLNASIDYKKAKETSIVDKGFLHCRLVYNLNSLIAPEVFYQKEFNKFISMKDRNLLGCGLRMNLHDLWQRDESNSLELVLSSGIMAENELLNFDSDSTANAIRSTNYLSCRYKLNDIVDFFGVLYFQVSFNKFSNYRMLNETGLRMRITKYLSFVTNFNYRLNNSAHHSLSKYDFNIINGLQFFF